MSDWTPTPDQQRQIDELSERYEAYLEVRDAETALEAASVRFQVARVAFQITCERHRGQREGRA